MFAKLFGTDDDQVLVLLHEGADFCAEIRVFLKPEGLGVSSVAIGYEKGDSGLDKAEAYFAKMNEADARDMLAVFSNGALQPLPPPAAPAVESDGRIEERMLSLFPSMEMKEAGGETYLQARDMEGMNTGLTPMHFAEAIWMSMFKVAPTSGGEREAALQEGLELLFQADEMMAHNERIFTGKWKKGAKAWSGDFIVRTRADGMAKLRALRAAGKDAKP